MRSVLWLSLLTACSASEPEAEGPVEVSSGTEQVVDQPESPEAEAPQTKRELARAVFATVQSGDVDAFTRYLPRPQSEEDDRYRQYVAMVRALFEEALADGTESGIVWANATYRGIRQSGSEGRPNIYIVFEHAGEVFSMKMDDCVRTDRGWTLEYLGAPQRGESGSAL